MRNGATKSGMPSDSAGSAFRMSIEDWPRGARGALRRVAAEQ
jgi:hypothetical protein